MDRLQPKKIIKPESILIEQTALELAAAFYEGGRSAGLKSKYKNPKDYARAYVKQFIPKAVELLMEMLAKDSTPVHMRDAIYDAFLERTNDHDLASTGIPVFDNPLAKSFVSDKVIQQNPLVGTSPINSTNSNYPAKKKKQRGRIEDLPLERMLHQKGHLNG